MADASPRHDDAVTVILAVTDRDTRRAWSQTLLEAGWLVRVVTRPAEVEKAQADGRARLILRRDHPDDALLARSARIPSLALSASHARDDLPIHLRKALAEGER